MLSKNYVHVLPGTFFSDKIEAEPGLHCLLSSGNFELNYRERDLELIETCFESASGLTITEKSTPNYICRYVCNNEGILCKDAKKIKHFASLKRCRVYHLPIT